jgi:uncharacterized protein (DUF433 family)
MLIHLNNQRKVIQGLASEVLATASPCGIHVDRRSNQHHAFDMLDWSTCPSVERVAERASGAWVFKGTRLPVSILFEHLEAGATVDDFLEWYEGVTREQVLDVLKHAERSLTPA